jgi:hypothetical protein
MTFFLLEGEFLPTRPTWYCSTIHLLQMGDGMPSARLDSVGLGMRNSMPHQPNKPRRKYAEFTFNF